MSLRVWLPFNGNLQNQGLDPVILTNYDVTFDTAGKISQCANFNGTSSYLQLDDSFSPNGLDELTVSCWLYPLTTSLTGVFLMRGSSAHRIKIYNQTFAFRDTNNSTLREITFTTLPIDTWTHLTCVYKHGEVWVYINGILDTHSTTYYNITSMLLSDINEMRIGRNTTTSGSTYFSGKINDFRIYDHALSAKEVEELAKGLVLHYKLDNNGLGGENLALNSQKLDKVSSKTNLYIYPRGASTRQLRNDGFYEVKCTAAWQGLSFWANTLNLAVGTKLTYSFYIYGNGSSRAFSFYPMMYNSAGTRDTSTGMPISIDGGAYTTVNAKSFTATTATTSEYHYVTFEWNQAVSNIISNGGSIELSIQVHGTWNTGDWVCVFAPKLEYGEVPTRWSPAPADLGLDTSIIYDSSGYNNNGILNDTSATISSDSARYAVCLKNNQSNNSGTYLLKGNINMPESSALTFSWWMNPTALGYQIGGIFSTSSLDLPTDYNTTAAHMYDSTFACTNVSGTCVKITVSPYLITNEWHHYVLTYNGSELNFYVDGISKVTKAQTGALKAFQYIFPFYSTTFLF